MLKFHLYEIEKERRAQIYGNIERKMGERIQRERKRERECVCEREREREKERERNKKGHKYMEN